MATTIINKGQKKNKNRVFSYNLTQRIEADYGRDLYNVSREVDNLVDHFISKIDLNKDNIQIHDVSELIEKLNEYSEKITDWANRTASKFIHNVEKHDVSQWVEHSSNMSAGMKSELKKADVGDELRKHMEANVNLIKSLPKNAARRIHEIVMNNLTSGRRAESVAESLRKTGQVTKSQANTIARTETSRAVTGLMKVRATNAGMNWFVWKVTHDNRLRKSHKILDNVLVRWDDPPNPEKLANEKHDYGKYLPGSIFNCRCYAAPLIRLSDVSFPARVYMNGFIKRMGMKEFMSLPDNENLKVIPNINQKQQKAA